MVTPNLGYKDIQDGESPLYTDESPLPPYMNIMPLAQASGSYLDSDTVQGITAVTAIVAGPNKLVATDKNGKLPIGIMPTSPGAAGVVSYVTGTYASIVATNPSNITMGIATTPGAGYTFLIYCGIATVGDNGWLLIAGS